MLEGHGGAWRGQRPDARERDCLKEVGEYMVGQMLNSDNITSVPLLKKCLSGMIDRELLLLCRRVCTSTSEWIDAESCARGELARLPFESLNASDYTLV